MSRDIGELRRDVSLSGLAAQFGLKLERDGYEFSCLCPFHSENTPSFTIYTGRDGVQRFHCFGCGEQGDVIDFVEKIKGVGKAEAINILGGGHAPANVRPRQVEARDPYAGIEPIPAADEIEVGQTIRLYNPKRAGTEMEWGQFTPSMVFPYRTADGVLIGYVLRRTLHDGGKETPMVMRVRLPGGKECWSRFPFPKPRPLYRLDKLRDGQVFIVEGEKCADYLAKITRRNFISWAGGTYGVSHADWSPLAGRQVILCPDADAPGLKTMHTLAAILAGIGCELRHINVSRAMAA